MSSDSLAALEKMRLETGIGDAHMLFCCLQQCRHRTIEAKVRKLTAIILAPELEAQDPAGVVVFTPGSSLSSRIATVVHKLKSDLPNTVSCVVDVECNEQNAI